ncbi:MAG: ATP-dependent DNA helicase RecG [Clostridia bacterium]|nr:ATP-dependent DNA helicase RecG [Clostridia bacterium]
MTLDTPIGALYGVGPKYEKYFSNNSLYTVRDLLYYFPRAYQNRADVCRLADGALYSEPHSYILTVASDAKVAMIRRGMNILKFKAFDESGTVNITFFNQNYLKDIFKTGATFRFWGKVTQEKRSLFMSSPSYEPFLGDRPLAPYVSVYPLFSGVNQKYLAKLIGQIRAQIPVLIKDHLPEKIRLENGLCTLGYALENIHFPESSDALERAIRRLTFDELFIFALSISQMKTAVTEKTAPVMARCDLASLLSQMPYELTNAQKRTISEIEADMCLKKAVFEPASTEKYVAQSFRLKPMNRIIVGDVGSGKTICAASASYIACKSGYQCALMVPTEILAFQHYEDLCPLFERVGISCELLTGSTPAKAKREILGRLKRGETQFVIGTHALIQAGVEFNRLGLVITDEQHRFGVMQRAKLVEKSKSAHVLVMSATPIPRTLSLMIYGDLDISLIDEMPIGRKRVNTFVVDESYRSRLNGFIRKQAEEGHQTYIVCPSVEEKKDDILDSADFNPFIIDFKDTSPLKSAVNYANELKEVFPDLRVEFLHGKMKSKEKDAVMMEFANGKIDILVSTTVIEVGVNVPNATLMVVENAERFGLSQLHQLRGRVGRGNAQSYCILVSDSRSQKSRERLDIMHTTYDGYTIAERDHKMRGPGDFFSTSPAIRQSGEVSFNIAKSCSDTELLHTAFESAKGVLSVDKTLSSPENALLRAEVSRLCDISSSTIS